MKPAHNPFLINGCGAVDVSSRIHMIEQFDLTKCRAALEVPGLQKSVQRKLLTRIKKLEGAELLVIEDGMKNGTNP